MSEELIEELARVLELGLARDVESDVFASETCIEERRCIAAAILPIIEREHQRGFAEGIEAADDLIQRDYPHDERTLVPSIRAIKGPPMKLTPEQIADGWIAHDGGPCPVNAEATVSMILGCGSVQTGWQAGRVVWPHNEFIHEIGEVIPFDARVFAYKLENPDAKV